MPEPISILAATGTAVSLLVNVTKGIIDVKEIYRKFKAADKDVRRAGEAIEVVQADLEEWRELWTGDNYEVFPSRMYEYFWGPSAYERIKRRDYSISIGLSQLAKLLDKYFQDHHDRNTRIRRAKFVACDSPDIHRIIHELQNDVRGLDKITRHAFQKRFLPPKSKKEDIEGLPVEFAIMEEQSHRLRYTLNLLDATDTSLALSPNVNQYSAATEGHQKPLWTQLRGDNLPARFLELNFVRNGRGTRLSYTVTKETNRKRRVDMEDELREIVSSGRGTGPLSEGLSIQECYQRLLQRGYAEQEALKRYTDLERIRAAVTVVDWALLTWGSPWTSQLCICTVACTFESHDLDRKNPRPLLRFQSNVRGHGCYERETAVRKHLLLGVLLAALALGCQVAIVTKTENSPRFVSIRQGDLHVMDTEALLDEVVRHSGGYPGWAHAIQYCLELDARREDKGKLEAADFRLYSEHVLEPLKTYRRILEDLRECTLGRGFLRTLQNIVDQPGIPVAVERDV